MKPFTAPKAQQKHVVTPACFKVSLPSIPTALKSSTGKHLRTGAERLQLPRSPKQTQLSWAQDCRLLNYWSELPTQISYIHSSKDEIHTLVDSLDLPCVLPFGQQKKNKASNSTRLGTASWVRALSEPQSALPQKARSCPSVSLPDC